MDGGEKPKQNKIRRTKEAGTLLSVARVETYLRKFNHTKSVAPLAAAAAAAGIGHVIDIVVGLASQAAAQQGRKTIFPVDIQYAIASDDALRALFPMSSVGTGAVPNDVVVDGSESESEECADKKRKRRKRRRPAEAASYNRVITKLVRSMSRARKSKQKKAYLQEITRLSRSRSRGRKYSRSRRVARHQKAVDKLIDEISRSRGRSPSCKRRRKNDIKKLVSMHRRRRGGKKACK